MALLCAGLAVSGAYRTPMYASIRVIVNNTELLTAELRMFQCMCEELTANESAMISYVVLIIDLHDPPSIPSHSSGLLICLHEWYNSYVWTRPHRKCLGEPHAPCSCETWTAWKETVNEMLPKLGGLPLPLHHSFPHNCVCTHVPEVCVERKNVLYSTCVYSWQYH